jgi:YaiO family outer membrane protein
MTRPARSICLAVTALTLVAGSARADDAPAPVDPPPAGEVAGGIVGAKLGSGLGEWLDQYSRANLQVGADDRLGLEVVRQRHFAEAGVFLGVRWERILGERWYASLSAGGGTAGFFLPRYRADAFLNAKWLDSKCLVTTLGLGYLRSRDVHSERSLFLGGTWYFEAPWILQVGGRLTQSDPGAVRSLRGFGALTWGRPQGQYLTLRYEAGREAYQAVSAGSTLVDFSSAEVSLLWRQWLGRRWGFDLQAARYSGPYWRISGAAGIFWEL